MGLKLSNAGLRNFGTRDLYKLSRVLRTASDHRKNASFCSLNPKSAFIPHNAWYKGRGILNLNKN